MSDDGFLSGLGPCPHGDERGYCGECIKAAIRQVDEAWKPQERPPLNGGFIGDGKRDGWRCPSCGRTYAPWVFQCPSCPVRPTTTITSECDCSPGTVGATAMCPKCYIVSNNNGT